MIRLTFFFFILEIFHVLIINYCLQKKIYSKTDDLKTKTAKNITLTEEQTKLQADLTKLKASVKNSNVLNLEMEVYEKSLNEVSAKLETKNTEISEVYLIMNRRN